MNREQSESKIGFPSESSSPPPLPLSVSDDKVPFVDTATEQVDNAPVLPAIAANGAIVVQRWHIFFILVIIFVGFTRFPALDIRPIHHDESLFAYYSHHLHKTFDYKYEPILHGPFMLDVNAIMYILFGDSTVTMRLAVAMMGAGIVLLLIPLLRRWLGHQGMLAAMLLFAISSTICYYSRFYRNDIPLVFFIMLGLLMMMHAFRTGRAWHVFWASFLILFPFCIKENIVMYLFSITTFAVLAVVVDLLKPYAENNALLGKVFQLNSQSEVAPDSSTKSKAQQAKGKNRDDKKRHKRRIRADVDFFPINNLQLLWISLGAAGIYFGLWFLHRITFEKTFLPFVWDTWFSLGLLSSNLEAIQKIYAKLIADGLILIQDGKVLLNQKESHILNPISPIKAWLFHIVSLSGLFFLLLALRWCVIREAGDDALLSRTWNLLRRNYHAVICGIALFCVAYVLIFTTAFQNKQFFPDPPPDNATQAQLDSYKPRSVLLSYNETILYWYGQHKEHRIKGPFHYYIPILMMYELPALLILMGGAFYAMVRRRGGQIILGIWALISLIMWFLLNSGWLDNTSIIKNLIPIDAQGWDGEKFQSRWHYYFLAGYAFWGVVLSVHYLWRRERFFAFTIFWFFTSLPLYSWAGEKVPWMAVHISVPLLLAAAIYIHKLLQSPLFLRRPRAWIAIFTVFIIWNVSLEMKLNFYNYENPAERLIYGAQNNNDLKEVAYIIYDYAERSGERKKLPILIKGEAIWPMRWYFRNYTNWTEWDDVKTTKRPIVILNWKEAQEIQNITENYIITKHQVRSYWQPKMLRLGVMRDIWKWGIPRQYRKPESQTAKDLAEAKTEWMKLVNYMLYRKPFMPPDFKWNIIDGPEFAFCVRKDFLR